MKYTTIASLTFIFTLIADVVVRINSFIGVSNGSTFLVLGLNIFTAIGFLILASRFYWREKMPKTARIIYIGFMTWCFISFLHGALSVEGYWGWKALIMFYLPSILVPLAIVLGLNFTVSFNMLRFVLTRIFLLSFLFLPMTFNYDTELYARVVIAVSVFILFIPYLQWRWRILVLIVAYFSLAIDFSYRVNAMRILIPLGLLPLYYNRLIQSKPILNTIIALAFCIPLILLYLGVTDRFNIFRDGFVTDSYVTVNEGGQTRDSNLSSDTRTFLYDEVFGSMLRRNSSFVIGEGGGANYESLWFEDMVVDIGFKGRASSEVGFLNMILYSGIISVIMYAAVLFSAAYYSINRSNNTLCKTLGIFLASHWVLFFVEDIARLDMNNYFIWFVVGLCFSNQFRALSDKEIKQFFQFHYRHIS